MQMDPITLVAGRDGKVTISDPAEPFAAAAAAYQADRYADALALFDRVATENPATQHGRSSLYNAGLCLEQLGRKQEATQRYRKLADENPDAPEALDALYRLGSTLVALKDWPASEEVHQRILKRKDLTLSDRVEAYARLGEAQFQQRRLEGAERTLHLLRELYRAHEQDERLDTDYFLAMGQFFLAEVSHEEFRLLPIRLPQKQLEVDLEAKARMVLLAQQRYIDTIRVKHVEWATAAGFRIGSLYRELYDDIVGAPIPPSLNKEEKPIYVDTVRKKLRTLLVKAVAFHENNVLMAERNGEKNDWVGKSTAQLEELRRLLDPSFAKDGKPVDLPPEPPRPVAPPREPNRATL